MDYLAILLSGTSPAEALRDAILIVEKFSAICKRYGFQLNMAKGKTECPAKWRGQGATQMRETLDQSAGDGAAAVATSVSVPVRFVASIGTWAR